MQASLDRLRQRRDEMGDEGGFTLIELLIVIVILGILAAIVVFAVQNLTSSSSQASCKSDYKTVETALETYKAQMGNYPDGAATGGTNIQTDTSSPGAAVAATANTILLAASSAGTNEASPSGTPVGPWLRDVPVNGTHYQIVVSNDGLGTITVTPTSTTVGDPCANAS